MLNSDEEKYLLTIPEGKATVIKPFDPEVSKTARDIIKQINQALPGLQVFFGGASALGIAGQNDIDMNILTTPPEYPKYLPTLINLFGQPIKCGPILIKWEFVRNGFEVEMYLTDKNSPTLQRQIKVYQILNKNPELRHEYEQIKLSCDGLPFREYMHRKYEFFHKILE
jgi:GrpB-like predicted nucleotidyltransferase (UPF0157 family)